MRRINTGYGFALTFVAILGTLQTESTAAAPASSAPMGRAAFERLLQERANPDSLATEAPGAWDQAYQYVLAARGLDRGLYERALLRLETHGCEMDRDTAVRLSCAANKAADVASAMTSYAAAVEFRRDAVGFAERVADRHPEALVDVLIDLATDEQTHGSLGEAEQAFERATAIVGNDTKLAGPQRRFRLAILRAKIADARLDDTAAAAAFAEAVDVVIRSLTKDTSSFASDYSKIEALSDLTRLHLRQRFCSGCGKPILDAARIWIETVLTERVYRDGGLGHAQVQHMLMALTAPPGSFTSAQMDGFARQFLRRLRAPLSGPVPPSVTKLMASRIEPRDAVVRVAFSKRFVSTRDQDADYADVLAALENSDERTGGKAMSRALKGFLQELEEYGVESDIAPTLDQVSRDLQHLGFRQQARATLQLMMDRGRPWAAGTFAAAKAKLATVYAPALARLASLDFAAGDRAAALRGLDEANALARVKLRREWESGGEGTILVLRDLAPTLRLIVQKRAEILLPKGASRDAPAHAALFSELQAAMFGETALAVEVAGRRRLLADPETRDLARRYQQAQAEAGRAAEVAGYALDGGDVGGARVAARRAAEARRDGLAAALRARVPGSLGGGAEVDPVTLAEARAHLREGEALVLLHQGSHGLHGFLLDAAGRSHAWRTDARAGAIEALVRSVRAGGDLTKGAFPPFPYEDAAKLHGVIFGPVAGVLAGYRKLVIVGDGPLQAMPYGLLLSRPVEQTYPGPDALRAASLPWLVRTHAVALLPSVRTLVAQRAAPEPSRAAKTFLGVGDPRLADASGEMRSIDIAGAFKGSAGGLADVTFLRRLVSLPETADELRSIASLLKAPPEALMLGEAATERAVRGAQLSDYRIIAFATHGALAGEITGTAEPGLVLTPPVEASREDDGFLALSEIMGLRLDADLVMLSACNTASSDGRPRAEGLSGLARGFFSTGARSLLVTHWAIPSESSVKITTGLIGHQGEHPSADWAEALRAATLAVIDGDGPPEWAHPAYWGGFAVVGVLPARP